MSVKLQRPLSVLQVRTGGSRSFGQGFKEVLARHDRDCHNTKFIIA